MVAQAPREPHTLEAHLPESPDKWLTSLAGQVRKNLGNHINAIVLGLGVMVAVNGPVHAKDNTQNIPPTSAETGSESQQIAWKLNWKAVTFYELWKMEPGAEKDEFVDGMEDATYARYEAYLKSISQAAITERQVLDRQIQATEKVLARVAGTPWE